MKSDDQEALNRAVTVFSLEKRRERRGIRERKRKRKVLGSTDSQLIDSHFTC